MNDWQKRYDAAMAEWQTANTLWIEAHASMTRVTARVKEAEHELGKIYHERIRQVNVGSD